MKLKGDLFPDWVPQPSPPQRRGHAGQPGNGPDGETCKSCQYYTLIMYAKAYRKCGLNQANWTHGAATDIRAGDPACEKWVRA